MVKNPPSRAGGVGSVPGQGTQIPHAAEQLSPHSTAREACSEEPAQPKVKIKIQHDKS